MKPDPDLDSWHVEVHYSRWRRIRRYVYHNRSDIIVVVGGILLLAAMLIVGPPVCGAFL